MPHAPPQWRQALRAQLHASRKTYRLAAEFDAIFERIKKARLSYGSAPWSLEDGKLNDWNGGRGVYFRDPNGHVLELMTVPQ